MDATRVRKLAGMAALLVVCFLFLGWFALYWYYDVLGNTTAHIQRCGDELTLYVNVLETPWGSVDGPIVELPPELESETSISGQYVDGTFYGPHGLEVSDLRITTEIGCW